MYVWSIWVRLYDTICIVNLTFILVSKIATKKFEDNFWKLARRSVAISLFDQIKLVSSTLIKVWIQSFHLNVHFWFKLYPYSYNRSDRVGPRFARPTPKLDIHNMDFASKWCRLIYSTWISSHRYGCTVQSVPGSVFSLGIAVLVNKPIWLWVTSLSARRLTSLSHRM